jgi:hypothetical protein
MHMSHISEGDNVSSRMSVTSELGQRLNNAAPWDVRPSSLVEVY